MRNTLLRIERLRHGWSQQQLADFALVSLSTVERAERGEPIRVDNIQRLCECLSKTVEELGLLKLDQKIIGRKTVESSNGVQQQPTFSSSEEREGCFSFGRLKTTWITLDGDGNSIYLPQHIRSHYIPFAEELPKELQARRDQIQQEQEQKKTQGLPSFWNGEIYALDRFVVGREPVNEDMTLDVWFRPSNYYTFLATNMGLKEPELRAKHLSGVDWYEAVPYFSHSFGISLAVVTSDGYTVFTQRGLHESIEFSLADILFLSFGVDTRYALRGLTGMVKIKRSREKLLSLWENGVRDKFENQKLFSVPFTPKDVISFAYTHQPFAPGPTGYYALVHEFGRAMVEEAFDQLDPFFVDQEE
jgi:transcriptional regulator with XRE-family HTH domain